MERFFKTLLLVCIIYLASAMVIAPVGCISAAREAITLCANVVIPSLFPFFICSRLFISLGAAKPASRYLSKIMRPVFGVPGGGAIAMIIGIISGYPLGASCAVSLYSEGYCTKTEAERLLTFCSNSGPLFIIGAVGTGILGSRNLGILLYTAHILAAVLTGILFRSYGTSDCSDSLRLPPSPDISTKNTAAAIGTAVSDSVDSIFKVCGFVILFAVFSAALPSYPGSEFVYAALEITGGTKALAASAALGRFLIPVISAFIAFSGISVLLQTSAIILPGGLSLKPYILGKLTHGVLSAIITMVLLMLFPAEHSVFAADALLYIAPTPRELVITALISIFWCAVSMAAIILTAWLLDK